MEARQARKFRFGCCAVGFCAAVATFTGCSDRSGIPSIVTSTVEDRATGQRFEIARASDGLMAESPGFKVSGSLYYAVNFTGNSVTVYNATISDPSSIATIPDPHHGPVGDCIDGAGTLYVADQNFGVLEFKAGLTKPFQRIQNVNIAAACAVDSKGNLWVAYAGGPYVIEYLKGSTTPHAKITAGLNFPNGIAIDHAGNIYVADGHGKNKPNVQVYPPGSKSPSRTITDGVKWPSGIAIDSKGTLYLANVTKNNVQEYRTGESHPYRTITKVNGPSGLVVTKTGWLYVASDGYKGGHGLSIAIVEFAPGSLSPSKRAITKDLHDPIGGAYYPPLLP